MHPSLDSAPSATAAEPIPGRDAIVLVDDDGRLMQVDRAASALLGVGCGEPSAVTIFDLIAADRDQPFRRAWRALCAGASAHEGERALADTIAGEVDIVGRNEAHKRVEYRFVARMQPGTHLGILRDVTERERLRGDADERLRDTHRQLRAVAARARARREEDRTRVARELHDQLGQSLAGLKMDVFWLRDRADAAGADQVRAKIDGMLALLDDTIHRVRRISTDLRPAVLDRLGLVAALEWAADEFTRRSGIATHLALDVHDLTLDRGRSTSVFRIVQEAFSNVATHARATRVDVRVSLENDTLVVEVADNGAGMAAEPAGDGQSLGLLGMHERAALLDGTAVIRSGPDGTVVTVAVPVIERRSTQRDDFA